MHLTNRKNSKISTYSRGMKQRLGLARALINNLKILFLDEPTLGLDPQGQEDIQALLQSLNQQGVTIFFSSHLLDEVAELCSRVALINHGKLVASGSLRGRESLKANNIVIIMNIKLLPIVTIFLLTFAQVTFADSIEPVSITILSAKTLSGTAGDYVMIKGQITNNTKQSISDITTYMSLVDTQDKFPVDLEDWSAEKGLFIGTIESGQTLPLTWKIHFVKAGTYALICGYSQ